MAAIIFAIVNVAKGCKSQSQPEPNLPLNSAILWNKHLPCLLIKKSWFEGLPLIFYKDQSRPYCMIFMPSSPLFA